MPAAGIFITIEGIEGAGKSTAIQWAQSYLAKAQQKLLLTREPGGTAIAEQIRNILLTPGTETIIAETELLLLFAARLQHVQYVILPALQQGTWVLCDRFVDASFAYQGNGRGIDQARIQQLTEWLLNGLRPHRTLLLDVPAEMGLSRAKLRGAADRIEQETIEFHRRVRQGYLDRAALDPERFRVIDATQPMPAVQAAVEQALHELL